MYNSNVYCPFIKGVCRKDCAFRRDDSISVDKKTSICQLSVSAELTEKVLDSFLREKGQPHNESSSS